MNPSRRSFLATAILGATAARMPLAVQALPADHRFLKNIGLQLWTMRGLMKLDLPGSLKAVQQAGYKQVELMNVETAHEVGSIARDLGLGVTSSFIDWQSIAHPTGNKARSFDVILEEAQAAQLKYLVMGYVGKGHRETEDQFKALADRCNAAAEKCAAAGIQLCYHHHSFEFKPFANSERCGFDVLIDRFDLQQMRFEIDIFWVRLGGWDPEKTLRKLGKRVAQVHLKDKRHGCPTLFDEMQVSPLAYKELGKGRIDIAGCIKTAEDIGVAQCHVEQDHSPDAVASIRESMAWLRRE